MPSYGEMTTACPITMSSDSIATSSHQNTISAWSIETTSEWNARAAWFIAASGCVRMRAGCGRETGSSDAVDNRHVMAGIDLLRNAGEQTWSRRECGDLLQRQVSLSKLVEWVSNREESIENSLREGQGVDFAWRSRCVGGVLGKVGL